MVTLLGATKHSAVFFITAQPVMSSDRYCGVGLLSAL